MYKASSKSRKYVKFEFVSGEWEFFQIIETQVSNFLFIVANSIP